MTTTDYFEHPRPDMLPFVPEQARRILDLGCGSGAFAASLGRQRDRELWGVVLDPGGAHSAAQRLDRVLHGDAIAELPNLPAGHFDCIVVNDLLEHLVHPEQLLAGLIDKLAPGGRLVASIPNVRHFHNCWDLVVHGKWEYRDEGILDRTHLRFFTRSSLRDLFTGSGWRLEQIVGVQPTGSLKFTLANLLALGSLSDMRYLQFACVAVPRCPAGTGEDS